MGSLFFLVCACSLQAQGDLPAENVTVLNNFQAQLLESQRLDIEPSIPSADTFTTIQRYSIASRNLNVEYPPPKIRPIALPREKLDDLYNGFAKVGFGIPTSFYAEGSYDFYKKDKFDVGFDLLHHSANFRNTPNQRFMMNQLSGEGTVYLDQGVAVGANLGYTSDDVYYYAYNFIDSLMEREIAKEDALQRFSTLDFGARIFNGERTVADFDYEVAMDLYRLGDNYASTEFGLDVQLKGTKWFNDLHSLDIVLQTDFTTFNDTSRQMLNNFYFQPAFTFHNDFLKAKLGINLASHDDEFFLFPDARVDVNILGSNLGAFVAAEGNLQKNTYRSLTDYNPFLKHRISIGNTRFNHYYGGVKGDIKVLQYSAQAGFQRAENLALFLAEDPLNGGFRQLFEVLYDTVSIVNIRGSLRAPLFEGFEVQATVNQNFFNPENEEKAWHLPALTVNGTLFYTTMEDKLRLKADLFIENGVPYLNEEGVADNLNGLFDISLGAAFEFSKNFGAFLDVNNLANNKRQRWENYPTFGTNILGGLTAKF